MSEKPIATVTNKARGKMVDHAAADIAIRDFPPLRIDEPPSRGGHDSGPSPLEMILAALCG